MARHTGGALVWQAIPLSSVATIVDATHCCRERLGGNPKCVALIMAHMVAHGDSV